MLKKLVVLALALAVGGAEAVLMAESAPKGGGVSLSEAKTQKPSAASSLNSWLKDLRKRITRTRARQNQVVAVAAVRGAEAADAPPLYWKGKRSSGPVDGAELDSFQKALDAAIAGQPDAGDQLKAFLSSYPKSSLAPDANGALERMQVAKTAP